MNHVRFVIRPELYGVQGTLTLGMRVAFFRNGVQYIRNHLL